ncbi:hypothetical protein HDU79_011176 [Rhizoclosmatium sp. JEL0117]|nr:hypothetical protein HDU79_011176 [Rhizoclosmatium sp. JEL0117]
MTTLESECSTNAHAPTTTTTKTRLPHEIKCEVLSHLPIDEHLLSVGRSSKAHFSFVLRDVSFARCHVRRRFRSAAAAKDIWMFLDLNGLVYDGFLRLPFNYQAAVYAEVLAADEWAGVKTVKGNDMTLNKMWYKRWQLPCKVKALSLMQRLCQEAAFFNPACQKNRPLRWAARNGNLDIVKMLVETYPFVNPGDDDNYAVYCAAASGEVETVDYLLNDPRVDPSADNQLAIQYSTEFGHLAVTQRLLQDPRVNPSQRDQNGPVRLAADNGHTEIVALLLSDPRVNPGDANNYAVILAARNGHADIVRMLLKHPQVNPAANVNEAIRDACSNGNSAVVEILLQDHRVDPTIVNHICLRDAVMNGHLEVVKLLCTVIDPAVEEQLAVQVAAECKQLEIAKYLITQFPSVDPSANNNFCLYMALDNKDKEMVSLMLTDTRVRDSMSMEDYDLVGECLRSPPSPI